MTEKEYLDKIENLISNLTEENAESTIKELDELFKIKPVRLMWFVAKAEAMLKMKVPHTDVYKLMAAKMWPLYDYNGIEKMSNLYLRMRVGANDIVDAKRHKYTPWICSNDRKQQFEELVGMYQNLEERINLFLDDIEDADKIFRLRNGYFMVSNYVCYMLVLFWLRKLNMQHSGAQFVKNMPNFGYLEECVCCEKSNTFIIAVSDNDTSDCEVAATILSLLGHKVYLLVNPMECPVDMQVNMADTLPISLENAQESEGVTIITPVEVIVNGESIGDNRGELISYISHECTENQLATVLCSGKLMDELRERPVLRKQMNRLSGFSSDGQEEYLAFGWAGDYMSYISMIYGFDTRAAIEAPAECEFSIVIPARNSAEYLRHTLKTCLNQRFKGSYEIVVSDNSINGNTAVYDLCKELNDPRIRYYRTPRDLSLPKSFEFAYLQAKGEFIFAIGSDDGVLPWGLEVLDKALKDNPNDEIVFWDRGFYAWPNFNKGQENQFIIPRQYKKNKFEYERESLLPLLLVAAKDKNFMYRLPMLYINSGFRRSYFKTLLNKTGYLWNGICQDIYMGVINAIINKEILSLNYPITIAGMTGNSEGFKSANFSKESQEEVKRMDETRKSNNIGGFSMSATERLIPETHTDTSSLYNCILRAATIGLISSKGIEAIAGWKDMFSKLASELKSDDIVIDKKLHYFRYTAKKHGDEFLDWFDKTYYDKMIQPKKIESVEKNSMSNIKLYTEGYSENGEFTLDASKYGVQNIFDAVRLFEDKTGL